MTESKITLHTIIELVCARFNIPRREIDATKISKRNSKYRFIVFAMAQKHVGMKCHEIAERFGVNHTSVLYGLNHYIQVMKSSDLWRHDIAYIESTLEAGEQRATVEIESMKPKPEVVAPPEPEPAPLPTGYRATISASACAEITADDTARIAHRKMWHSFAEWEKQNPIDIFVLRRLEPAKASQPAPPVKPTPEHEKIFRSAVRKIASSYGVKPSRMMLNRGAYTHPGRREVLTLAADNGLSYEIIAKIIGVSASTIESQVNRHRAEVARKELKMEAA